VAGGGRGGPCLSRCGHRTPPCLMRLAGGSLDSLTRVCQCGLIGSSGAQATYRRRGHLGSRAARHGARARPGSCMTRLPAPRGRRARRADWLLLTWAGGLRTRRAVDARLCLACARSGPPFSPSGRRLAGCGGGGRAGTVGGERRCGLSLIPLAGPCALVRQAWAGSSPAGTGIPGKACSRPTRRFRADLFMRGSVSTTRTVIACVLELRECPHVSDPLAEVDNAWLVAVGAPS